MAVFSGNGSNTAPSFTFSSDTDTGMYRANSDEVALVAGGVAGLRCDSNGDVLVSNGKIITNITDGATFILRRNSTTGTADDLVGKIDFFNNDSSSPGARTTAQVGANVEGTAGGTYLFFNTAANGQTIAEAARITGTNKYLRMASGTGGIQFGGDTAAANALNDYEEGRVELGVTGSWTGDIECNYIKIGRFITINIGLNPSGTATFSPGDTITGLPFALDALNPLAGGSYGGAVEVLFSATSAHNFGDGYILSGTTTITIRSGYTSSNNSSTNFSYIVQ